MGLRLRFVDLSWRLLVRVEEALHVMWEEVHARRVLLQHERSSLVCMEEVDSELRELLRRTFTQASSRPS